jgi:hypothetical protein
VRDLLIPVIRGLIRILMKFKGHQRSVDREKRKCIREHSREEC